MLSCDSFTASRAGKTNSTQTSDYIYVIPLPKNGIGRFPDFLRQNASSEGEVGGFGGDSCIYAE